MRLTATGDAKASTLITAIVGMCKELEYCPSFVGWEDHPECGGEKERCDSCWEAARIIAAKEE